MDNTEYCDQCQEIMYALVSMGGKKHKLCKSHWKDAVKSHEARDRQKQRKLKEKRELDIVVDRKQDGAD